MNLGAAAGRGRTRRKRKGKKGVSGMSTLVAIAYPEQGRAREVMDVLKQLQAQHLIEMDDAVAVVKDDEGKIKLDQAVSLTGAGAAGGALWGMLIGLLFLSPLLGAAVGAATGAIGAKMSDYGLDDNFARQLGAQLRPGTSALLGPLPKRHCAWAIDVEVSVRRYGRPGRFSAMPADPAPTWARGPGVRPVPRRRGPVTPRPPASPPAAAPPRSPPVSTDAAATACPRARAPPRSGDVLPRRSARPSARCTPSAPTGCSPARPARCPTPLRSTPAPAPPPSPTASPSPAPVASHPAGRSARPS